MRLGQQINNDNALEREADVMGAAAMGAPVPDAPMAAAPGFERAFDLPAPAPGNRDNPLLRDLGASAFTQGDRVSFAPAPQQPQLAHELAHVVQQR